MLVLSRKRGERIVIGDNIVVTIVDVDRDKVRVGIDAPREVPVNREEIHRLILEASQRGGQERGTQDGSPATP